MSSVRLRQVRSAIGSSVRQRATLTALGLGRIGATSERSDSPAIRGMVAHVRHLVESRMVDEAEGDKQADS
jgi:large subunit ribosomal protein L30